MRVKCAYCEKTLSRGPSKIKKSKTGKFFCNQDKCKAKYIEKNGNIIAPSNEDIPNEKRRIGEVLSEG